MLTNVYQAVLIFLIPCALFLASIQLLRNRNGLKKTILFNAIIIIFYAIFFLSQSGLAPILFIVTLYWHSGIVFVIAIVKKIKEMRLQKSSSKNERSNKKKILWVSIIFCLILVTSYYAFKHYSYPLRNTYSHITSLSSFLYDFNHLEVKVSATLDANDFIVVNTNSGKAIYKNGRVRKGIRNEYGETLFKLYYKDEHIASMGHFKENGWETNDYEIILEMEGGKPNPKMFLIGKNAKKYDIKYSEK